MNSHRVVDKTNITGLFLSFETFLQAKALFSKPNNKIVSMFGKTGVQVILHTADKPVAA